MSEKLFLRDVGSHPERDLEVTLFPDGELQFEVHQLMYVHINISRDGVEELLNLLLEKLRPTPRALDAAEVCDCGEPFPESGYCKFCGAHQRQRQ